SVAMLLHEYATANACLGITPGDFSVLATDVSARVLTAAAAATYLGRDLVRGLSSVQINRHFDQRGQTWVLKGKIRQLVEFRRVNLVQPFAGLGVFDVILCRNVLIYFDDPTRRRICAQLADMLTYDGYLLLGSAENLYGVSEKFESVRFG